MRAARECPECLLRVFEGELELAKIPKEKREKTMKELRAYMSKKFSMKKDPYSQVGEMEKIVKRAAARDYFKQLKEEMNRSGREICSGLKADSLEDAMKIALAGNSLDLLHLTKEEAVPTAMRSLQGAVEVDERKKAVELINHADEIIYVSDNAGEVFFDRFLVEGLRKRGKKVRYVVRATPMSNDATESDAKEAGIDRFAEIEKFDGYGYKAFEGHPLIISKGHAGWVTLSEGNPSNIIFIVKVKRCGVIASSLGVRPGAGVIKVV